ncbi:MAG: hypothetical protein ACE5DX_02200 [Candidatus Dojkabacteria bacterium]
MSIKIGSTNVSGIFWKYILFGVLFTALIAVFSVIMAGIASFRNEVTFDNYLSTQDIYHGPLEQSAPSLQPLEPESELYIVNRLDEIKAKSFIDNTLLSSTDATVVIDADFVKKGLSYQPTFRTSFDGVFTLKNKLNEKSVVKFVFPLPVSNESDELSNARLVVGGKEVENAKTTVKITDEYGFVQTISGLKWQGEITAGGAVDIQASYNTVGLSFFTYEGIENSKSSQDIRFALTINGTRSYNVTQGLSVDEREFGEDYVKLTWDKTDLFSKPLISVSVGEKLNPSTQVSRVYLTMAPIYVVFFAILLYTSFRFGKILGILDMFLLTVLFTVFFPLVHYLSSFTIDPTMELFAGMSDVGQFSMPIYGAFVIAWTLIGGIMLYLTSRISGFKYSLKFALPALILFMGFFPLVVTVPEYSMLLVILGFVALVAIVVQVRINVGQTEKAVG